MFDNLKRARAVFTGQPQSSGSASTKLVEHERSSQEARGRILALDAAHQAKHSEIDLLEADAARVHGDSESIRKRLTNLLAEL